MKKKAAALVAACVTAVILCLYFSDLAVRSSYVVGGLTVVIDAGHGGIDGGVTGAETGVKESDLNLEIAKALKEYFVKGGFSVVMTRTTSAGLYGAATPGFKRRDMSERKRIINGAGAAAMISVHLNSYSSPSRSGAQVFYKGGDERSKSLAEAVQAELNGDGRQYAALEGDYYVLNESNCPAIICECGFLSNASDEKKLLTADYRDEIAYSVFKATVGFLAS